MSEELAARLMARIAVPPMPFAPDTYTAGRMDQFTEMITQLRALPEVDKEQVLADVKARIEGAMVDLTDRHDDDPYLKGYRIARRDALAALTQKGEGNDGLYADQNCCVHCGWITCARLEDCLATEGDNES